MTCRGQAKLRGWGRDQTHNEGACRHNLSIQDRLLTSTYTGEMKINYKIVKPLSQTRTTTMISTQLQAK